MFCVLCKLLQTVQQHCAAVHSICAVPTITLWLASPAHICQMVSILWTSVHCKWVMVPSVPPISLTHSSPLAACVTACMLSFTSSYFFFQNSVLQLLLTILYSVGFLAKFCSSDLFQLQAPSLLLTFVNMFLKFGQSPHVNGTDPHSKGNMFSVFAATTEAADIQASFVHHHHFTIS